MNEVMVIEGTEIERIEYQGQPVLSLPMVDATHQRPDGTARKAFNRNREKFVSEEDYYDLPYDEWSKLGGHEMPAQGGQMPAQKWTKGDRGDRVFLTLSGYLMLVKTFTDDLSWNVQRSLVKSYFKLRDVLKSAEQSLELVRTKEQLIATQQLLIEKFMTRRIRKNYTKEEVVKIRELADAGKVSSEIAAELGRNPSSVRSLLRSWGYEPKKPYAARKRDGIS